MKSDVPKKRWKLFGDPAQDEDTTEESTPTVKVEVKHLRRVVKLKPRARRHGSEAFQEQVTQEDLKITQEVMGSLDSLQSAPEETDEDAIGTFACFECGEEIEMYTERCPKCGVLYIVDPTGGAAQDDPEPDGTETLGYDDVERLVKEGTASCIHLEVTSGKIHYLSKDEEDPDFGLECHNCGAVIQFGTDRCPMCGKEFEDEGLLSLLDGLKFDPDNDGQMECPSCGEHIDLDNGLCPKCHELIRARDPQGLEARVLPLLDAKNIIFVHLDAASGELQFVQKFVRRKTVVDTGIHLESLGSDTFQTGREWKGLQRI